MPNMSYCRFENTSRDVEDCLDSLRRCQRMGKSECGYALAMFQAILDFCLEERIIEDYDREYLRNYLTDLRERSDEEED